MMKKYFISVALSFSLVFALNAMAQDSNYKVKIVEGKKYYEYPVQTSEGFYSVSKKFHVTESQIKAANPGTEKGLTKGSVILIPVHDEYTFHKVAKGETVYSLKNKYNTTSEELYKLNPTLKSEGLKVGSEIKIPKLAQTSNTNKEANKITSSDKAPIKKETKPGYTSHVVKKEETLSSISRAYGVSTEEIIRLNPDAKDGVKTGKTLIIPPVHKNTAVVAETKPTAAPVVPEKRKTLYRTHKVQKKETLFSICQQYNVSQEDVVKLNPGVGQELEEGKILIIPGDPNQAALAPSSNKMNRAHKVQKKETLFSICQQYGVSKEEVIKLNPGVDLELVVGRVLTIPAASNTSSASESDKVIYRIHKVKKKETLFSISQDYNVTPEEIVKLNPGADKKLKKNMVLTIPPVHVETSETASVEKHYGTHIVQKGETIFSIAKRYGISNEDIIKNNSDVEKDLNEGRVLLIVQDADNEGEKAQDNGCTFHKVEKEETFFSISQKYGITMYDLDKINQGAKYDLLAGRVLIIPTASTKLTKETNPKAEVNVALALPFNFEEIAAKPTLDGKTDKFVELYQGMLVAVDSLKKRGLSVNLHIYDSGNTEADAKHMLIAPELKNMDFIIGPAYAAQIKVIADFSKNNNIKLIIPFSSKSEETIENRNIFQINTPQDQHNYLTAKSIIETFKGSNIVIVSFKNESYNTKAELKDTLIKMLDARKLKYKTLEYAGIESMKKELSDKEENVVIPLTTNQVALNQILPVINMMGDKETVSIVGFPEWLGYQTIYKDLFRVNTYIPNTFYINFNDKEVLTFIKSFRKMFGNEPENIQPQYGLLGYDLMMYFSDAVSSFGKDFEERMADVRYKSLQVGLKFKKISVNGGYYNGSIYLTKHDPKTGLTAVSFE
ncbi:MAG TPA: LysM peptidoglycan-binding domain-containing protein [Paludibacteraceae bacterium]|nr:LysM peptidoglycan-binding domain-containing protein [Paludibacteraceae bacterium]